MMRSRPQGAVGGSKAATRRFNDGSSRVAIGVAYQDYIDNQLAISIATPYLGGHNLFNSRDGNPMSLPNSEGKRIPEVTFRTRADGQWKDVATRDLFAGRTVVVFALPGAYTPTCSSTHLPRYNEL